MPAIRIAEFDTWRPGYGAATVTVYKAGTTTNASIFTDEALSVAATNPQTLETLTQNGVTGGKFTAPLFIGEAYELDIDSTDSTGVVRPPLTTLVAQKAERATVRRASGTTDPELEDIVARTIYAEDFGAIGATAATNNATLTAAIGVAAGLSGGRVIVPAGTIPITGLTLSAGVVLVGQGIDVTTITCTTGAEVITLSGDSAGLYNLTLDGVSNVASSVGVFGKSRDKVVFDDVLIKRFETGIYFKGGRYSNWKNLSIDTCGDGAKLHGDTNAGGGSDGDEFNGNWWDGGQVSNCTGTGIDLEYVDTFCSQNRFRLGFKDNTGTAFKVVGARFTKLEACWWSGNTTNFSIEDDAPVDADNTVIGLHMLGGRMNGGSATLTGKCTNIIIEKMEIRDVDFTLTLPDNPILVKDCTEDSDVTISGQGEKWMRWRSIDKGVVAGLTTDATITKAWAISLKPAQAVFLEAKVIGNRQNGENRAEYWVAVSAHREGATLDYDAQTANFTVGSILTGATSEATARIIADTDSGTTGTLTLRDIVGTFQNNETITDAGGGSATADGVISVPTTTLQGSVASIRTAREDVGAWDATFAANSPEVELQVTGAAGDTIEWLAEVKLLQT